MNTKPFAFDLSIELATGIVSGTSKPGWIITLSMEPTAVKPVYPVRSGTQKSSTRSRFRASFCCPVIHGQIIKMNWAPILEIKNYQMITFKLNGLIGAKLTGQVYWRGNIGMTGPQDSPGTIGGNWDSPTATLKVVASAMVNFIIL